MPSQGFQLTPEQMAVQEARKLKKKKNKNATPATGVSAQIPTAEKGAILARPWLTVQKQFDPGYETVKIMTWNLLAQCLVRRELFPTSDCLKANQREDMLYREVLSSDADILCLQEVDRLEKLVSVLTRAGYDHTYAAGPNKKHGCLIAYRKTAYEKADARVIRYDEADIRPSSDERARRGLSFRTKNITSIVALRRVGSTDEGIVVATTHLFWHPSYSYERARQAGLMLRETTKFRDENGFHGWPCVLAGDFNFSPEDPGYSLLVGDPLTPDQETRLHQSRVVHVSVDPSIPVAPAAASADDEGAADPDRVITNARPAGESDGLLSTSEFIDLYAAAARPRSVYDRGQRLIATNTQEPLARCGPRLGIHDDRRGAFEPEWTSYTHYWKTVLDYIFVIDPPDRTSSVLRLLAPHKTEDLEPGLPQKGISGSDHVSLAAELQWLPNV